MDEPLSALDAKLREVLRVELKRLHNELGATFLFVTHDQVEAMSMGDHIGVLNNGRLVQTGTPMEIYENPRNTFVARSVGTPAMNLLAGTINRGKAEISDGAIKLPIERKAGEAGQEIIFGVRPENLVIESGAPAEARVFDIENHGVNKILALDVGRYRLHSIVPGKTKIALDEVVRFGWRPDKVLLFDRKNGESLL